MFSRMDKRWLEGRFLVLVMHVILAAEKSLPQFFTPLTLKDLERAVRFTGCRKVSPGTAWEPLDYSRSSRQLCPRTHLRAGPLSCGVRPLASIKIMWNSVKFLFLCVKLRYAYHNYNNLVKRLQTMRHCKSVGTSDIFMREINTSAKT